MLAVLRNWEAPCIAGVPSPLLFVNSSSAFIDRAKRFGYHLLEAAMTEVTIMSLVCFILAAEYGETDLFLPAGFWSLVADDGSRESEVALVLLLCVMRAIIVKGGLLLIIRDCAADPAAAISTFAPAGKTD